MPDESAIYGGGHQYTVNMDDDWDDSTRDRSSNIGVRKSAFSISMGRPHSGRIAGSELKKNTFMDEIRQSIHDLIYIPPPIVEHEVDQQ